MIPKYKRGDNIRLKNKRDQVGSIVDDARFQGGEFWYRVRFGNNVGVFPENSLEIFTEPEDPLSLLKEGVYSTKESFSKLMTFNKLKVPLRNTIYAYQSARIELLPYQYRPLLKFLDSDNQRILIADEVGLGKTIEAGLILHELKQRLHLRRVLIVCPAHLTHKWRLEMRDRFQEDFRILNAQTIREFIQQVVENDAFAEIYGICSLQSLRNNQIRSELQDAGVDFDLVIVDEAHHLRNPDTNSHKLARFLSEVSTAMILLTATPVHTGDENLFNLFRILDPHEFSNSIEFSNRLRKNQPIVNAERLLRTRKNEHIEEAKSLLLYYKQNMDNMLATESKLLERILYKMENLNSIDTSSFIAIQHDLNKLNSFSHILTRTRKREVVEKAPKRTAQVIPIEWSELEAKFYQLVTDYVIKQRKVSTGPFEAFITMMPQRQVASCIPAMLEYYKDRLQWSSLSFDLEHDAVEFDEINDDTAFETINRSQQEFYNVMRDFINNSKIPDTKFEKLVQDVLYNLDKNEPNRKIIIFSYFKKTLEYLSRRLIQEGYSNTVISGDYDDEERRIRIEAFRSKEGPRILLSSEVGSEGLDLQFCNIMINYDLPWNPMIVEQRIGRLDRYGQMAGRILIFNFSIKGTIEERILGRLYERIGIFESSIGDLEPILGEEIKALQKELLSSHLTTEEMEEKIERTLAIIESKRQMIELLEKESAKFVGHHEFFDEEISRIKENRRFISPEELHVFVIEFFRSHLARNVTLKHTIDKNIYELNGPSKLLDFLNQYLIEEYRRDNVFNNFSRKLSQSSILITFDSTTASRQPDLEFINWSHPLIRAIIRYYELNEDKLSPVARLEIVSESVPKGDYLFIIYLFKLEGANLIQRTTAVFVPIEINIPLDETTSEKLLAELISHSQTFQSIPEIDKEFVGNKINVIENHFHNILAKHKSDQMELNDAVLDVRLRSLKDTWNIQRKQREENLRKAKDKGSPAHYIRMLEQTLNNKQAEYEKKVAELEQRRLVTESYEEIAAGFLRVN